MLVEKNVPLQPFNTFRIVAKAHALVRIASEDDVRALLADAEWGASLLGDKAHSMVFDNRKVKALVPGWVATVPFHRGAREIIDWFDADPARRQVDATIDATMSRLVEAHRRR